MSVLIELRSLAQALESADECESHKAETPEQVENRLFLCDVTARTLHRNMALLDIRTPERL
ncbi:hypothetical protein GCM10023080_091560 [Streptomyces pseudoechinosporeus]